jgi:hypothetical protein
MCRAQVRDLAGERHVGGGVIDTSGGGVIDTSMTREEQAGRGGGDARRRPVAGYCFFRNAAMPGIFALRFSMQSDIASSAWA